MRQSASPLASILLTMTIAAAPAVGLDPAAGLTPTAGPEPAAPAAGPAPAAPMAPASPAPVATRPSFVPCPVVKVKPIGPLPKPSPMPTHDASLPAIGGAGLDTAGLAVPSGAPAVPKLTATSWIVADLDTGAVLGACAPHEYGAPASLQKLLLAQTVLPKLDAKDTVTVTAEDLDFEPGSSAVGLLKGGTYSVETLWLGLFLNSGNDAARVLARLGGDAGATAGGDAMAGGDAGATAGGLAGTMAAMNAEARRLGAIDTHAETPSGLDGPGQVTSAYDLALIARALFAREDFRRYVTTMATQIPAQPPKDKHGFQIQNDNRLMYEYPGALGGKTGFTDIARHTYMGAAQRDGRQLVVALLGAERRPLRSWQQGAALLDWGFSVPSDASVGHLVSPGEADSILAEAAAASPSPAMSVGAVGGIGAAGSGPPVVLIGVAAIGSAFVLVWVAVLIAAQRRRAARRAGGAPP